MGKKIKVLEVEEDSPIVKFFKNLKDSLVNNLMSNLKDNLKEKIVKAEKKIFRSVTSYILFILGMIFIFISGVFFINYYLNLNYFWGFIIFGFLFILIALVFRWSAKSL